MIRANVVSQALFVLWCLSSVWLAACLLLIAAWPRVAAYRLAYARLGLVGLWGLLAICGLWHASTWNVWAYSLAGYDPVTTVVRPAQQLDAMAGQTQLTTPPAHEEEAALAVAPRRLPVVPRFLAPVPSALAQGQAVTTASSLPAIAIGLWLAGIVVLTLSVWRQQQRLANVLLRSEPLPAARLPEGSGPVVPLYVSDEVASAALCGWRRPVLLVPRTWLASTPHEEWRLILQHEWSHLANRDPVWHGAFLATSIVWWPQPLIWALSQQWRRACEDVADNRVLSEYDPTVYAETLVRAAQLASGPVSMGLALFRQRSLLSRRVEGLLDPGRDRRVALSDQVYLVVSGVALALLVAVGSLVRVSSVRASDQAQPFTTPTVDTAFTPTGEIGVRVTRAGTGDAMPGVTVRLLPKPSGAYVFPLEPLRLVTDADGRCRFRELRYGEYRLYAFHDDLASRTKSLEYKKITLGAAPLENDVLLPMHATLSARVEVRDEATNGPLVGAKVRLRWTDLDDDFETDEHGLALVQGLVPGQQFFSAFADGYELADRTIELKEAQTTVSFRLQRGGVLAGRVVDATGQPLAGIELTASSARKSMSRYDEVVTQADGTFMLRYLPLQQTFRLAAAGLLWESLYEDVSLPKLTDVANHRIVLARRPQGGSVVGVIRDNAGAPIHGAIIRNHGSSSAHVREARSTPEGEFSLQELYVRSESATPTLIARATGFAPEEFEMSQLPRDSQDRVLITLQAGNSIRGKVVNKAGQPVAGATVYYADGRSHGGIWGVGGKLTTDNEGRFQSNSLPDDRGFEIVAAGFSQLNKTVESLNTDHEVVFELEPTARIQGCALDAVTGKPLEAFNVRFGFADREKAIGRPITSMPADWLTVGRDFVGQDGEFVWDGLENQVGYDLILTATGYEPRRMPTVIAEPNFQRMTARLTPEDPRQMAQVRGRVQDKQGQPLAGVVVHLVGIDEGAIPANYSFPEAPPDHLIRWGQGHLQPMCKFDLEVVTDRAGKFEFPKTSRQWRWDLVCWNDTVPLTRLKNLQSRIAAELADLEVTPQLAATLHVRIDRKTFPRAGYVSATTEGHPFVDRRANIEGDANDCQLTGVMPGRVQVTLYDAGQPTKDGGKSYKALLSREMTLQPGETREVLLKR